MTLVSPIQILLVEDDVADAHLFKHVLSEVDGGVKLHVEDEGDKAIQFLLERARNTPVEPQVSAVVLDVHLPRKSGVQTLRELRSHRQLEEVPVFLFSGAKNVNHLVKGLEDKYQAVIPKPTCLDEFAGAIRTFLASLESYMPRRY